MNKMNGKYVNFTPFQKLELRRILMFDYYTDPSILELDQNRIKEALVRKKEDETR
jgi:hypothetical protein